MEDSVRGVNLLQSELEKAKESLKGVDENIKKLTGRDPEQRSAVPRRVISYGTSTDISGVRGRESRVDNRLFSLARRGIMEDGPSPAKRRPVGGAFARLGPRPRDQQEEQLDSGDEDELPNKPSVQSSVIATPKDIRTRQKSIDEQSKDTEGRARNRRMFGHMIGTLRRFKDDAKTLKEKEEQRKEIEKKLEDKFKQEKIEIIQERRQLFQERKHQQQKIRLLEQKVELVENHENWEIETRRLGNFLRSKAKPCIYYMPKVLTSSAGPKLEESKKIVEETILEQRKKLEDEIDEIMKQAAKLDQGEATDPVSFDTSQEADEDGQGGGENGDRKFNDDKENKQERRKSSSDKKEDKERHSKNDSSDKRDQSREKRHRSRDRSGDKRDRSRDKERRDKKRRHSRDRSSSRERRRSSSGKNSSDRRRSGENKDREGKSKGSSSFKSKRHSHGDGKTERKEKVWEPMEDEDDDYEDDVIVGEKVKEREEERKGTITETSAEKSVVTEVKENLPESSQGDMKDNKNRKDSSSSTSSDDSDNDDDHRVNDNTKIIDETGKNYGAGDAGNRMNPEIVSDMKTTGEGERGSDHVDNDGEIDAA